MPVRLLLPTQIYNDMVAQAVAELPNECCGLLAGRIEELSEAHAQAALPCTQGPGVGVRGDEPVIFWRVERRYPLLNKAASPTEYFGEEHSLFAAYRDMGKQGLDILSVYHSHPTSAPIPSRKDREMNYLGEVVHFIISLQRSSPTMRGWWLTESDYYEVSWELHD